MSSRRKVQMIKSLRSAVVALVCLGASLVALAPAASASTPKPTGPVVVTAVNIIDRKGKVAWDNSDVIFKATTIAADGTPLCEVWINNTTAYTQRYMFPAAGSRPRFISTINPYHSFMTVGGSFTFYIVQPTLAPVTVNDQLHAVCQA
jgi:hypothetical protein